MISIKNALKSNKREIDKSINKSINVITENSAEMVLKDHGTEMYNIQNK